MNLFTDLLEKIHLHVDQRRDQGRVRDFERAYGSAWPLSGERNLILGQETAVELGHPKDPSVSFLVWENNNREAAESRVSLMGPDVGEIARGRVPFGKILIISGRGFTPDNGYDRYLAMDQIKYNTHPQGYMMRGASPIGREWSRISKDAVAKGFSFGHLGWALVNRLMEFEFVTAVELLFVTENFNEVASFHPMAEKARHIMGALNKMTTAMSYDCDECDYTEVCRDVAALRAVRRKNKETA